MSDRLDPHESCWDVVLVRTSRGEDEIRRPIIPLSKVQQDILMAIDGVHSLHDLVRLRPELKSHRLSRDCARLLAFGVVKPVRGALPQQLVIQAMNLTVRLPANALRRPAQAATLPNASEVDRKLPSPPGQRAAPATRAARPLFTLLLALGLGGAALWLWIQR